MNIANFINIYMQIYIPVLYVTKMAQYCKMVALSTIIAVQYFLLQDFHI